MGNEGFELLEGVNEESGVRVWITRALLPTLPPAQLASGDASQESGLVRETITIESMLAFAPEIFFELFTSFARNLGYGTIFS